MSMRHSELSQYALSLIKAMRFEVVPMSGNMQHIKDLPPGCPVSVTCSPKLGIVATLKLCDELIEKGHDVTPHFAAKMVKDREHTRQLANWTRDKGVKKLFVVGGDSAFGLHYDCSVRFMKDFLNNDHKVQVLSFAAYPDGHPHISDVVLHNALLEKQQLVTSAGLQTTISTQLCFDPNIVVSWLRIMRNEGICAPVSLGIPGVIDRQKLFKTSIRLGIGSTIRFMMNSSSTVTRLFSPTGYDPTDIFVANLGEEYRELNVTDIHSCTFNCIKDTALWQQELLS